ncbi:hypothetical protein FG386_001965 [Cryptosporidium ryanae]|uniref:uncharacterized protein n=1 Tax=Cryptosporidium ryanae TaxID=515981 RepID=UPI00351A751A|nr:hypothetical protein FG386_001965 [Cryptosporidium ryanae]
MKEGKLINSKENFDGLRTTSSLFSGLETLSSTREIDLEADIGDLGDKDDVKGSFQSIECDKNALDGIELTASNMKNRSLLFHIERSLLLGTVGVSLKSLCLAIGIFSGHYWNFLFLFYFIFSFPIYCFSTRHDYLNKLFIFTNTLFPIFSLFLLVENSTIVINSHRIGTPLERNTEIRLVVDIIMLIGTSFGMIFNSVNSCRLRKVICNLEKQYIDSCLGHRIVFKIDSKTRLLGGRPYLNANNCVTSITR